MLKFVWLHPEIKIQEQDIDNKLLFPCFGLIIDGKKKKSNTQVPDYDKVVLLCRHFSVSED